MGHDAGMFTRGWIMGAALLTLVGCTGRHGRSSVPEYQVHINALSDGTAQTSGSYVLATPRGAQLAIFLSYGLGEAEVSYAALTDPSLGLAPSAAAPATPPAAAPATPPAAVPAARPAPGAPGFFAQAAPAPQPAPPPAPPPMMPPPVQPPPPAQPPPPPPMTGSGGGVVEDRATMRMSGNNRWSVTSKRTYPRFVHLSAVDLPSYLAGGELRERWRVTVTSHGYTRDLRIVLPVLIAAARNVIATDTGSAKSLWIKDNDPRVEYVRGKAPATPAQ